MNIGLRRKAKIDFEKDFLKLMDNTAFGKTMEKVRKHLNLNLSQQKKKELFTI